MKKFIFICIATLAIFSCSTDEVSEVNTLKVESVLRIKNDEDLQRISYGLLNENEKMRAWNSKFSTLLEQKELNSKQKELIKELQNNLAVSVFSDSKNDEKEYFKNIFVAKFLKKIEKEFTLNQANDIFYSLANGGEPEDDPSILLPPDFKKDCNCNQGSLFGCGASQNCKIRTCEGLTKGCGFLWAWECNGLCNF